MDDMQPGLATLGASVIAAVITAALILGSTYQDVVTRASVRQAAR